MLNEICNARPLNSRGVGGVVTSGSFNDNWIKEFIIFHKDNKQNNETKLIVRINFLTQIIMI